MPSGAGLAVLIALTAPAAAPPTPLAPAGGARAAQATRALVAAPYLVSPLGEGLGPDPDPRFRLDAFDCMTFVETAVALASASTEEEAALALDDVRYGRGPPSRAGRNHEVLSQWIPSNLAKGWISDITAAVAGARVRRVEKTYTEESWAAVRAAGRTIPGLPRSRLPLGRFAIDVVPADAVGSVARRLPDGAVVFVVRGDAAERATRVAHAGVVVRSPGGPRVRHATSSKGVGRVIEEPLGAFVRRQQQAYPRWPLEGFSFYALPDNAPRLHALGAAAAHPAAQRPTGRPPASAPL